MYCPNNFIFYLQITLYMGYLHQNCKANDDSTRISNLYPGNKSFKPIIVLETWGTYSINEKNNNADYANQFDIKIRRLMFCIHK